MADQIPKKPSLDNFVGHYRRITASMDDETKRGALMTTALSTFININRAPSRPETVILDWERFEQAAVECVGVAMARNAKTIESIPIAPAILQQALVKLYKHAIAEARREDPTFVPASTEPTNAEPIPVMMSMDELTRVANKEGE